MKVIPVWRVLISFSRSRFVSSSLIWVAIVPIFARMTEGVAKAFRFQIGDTVHTFHLAVPFTWSLFFFGALFFLLGNLIISWKAPRIILETQTFRDFTDQGRSPTELEDLAETLKPGGKVSEGRITETRNNLARIRSTANSNLFGSGPPIAQVMESAVSASYEFIVNEACNYYHRTSRGAATASYAVGILFYGFVLGQSTWYVLKHLLRTMAQLSI